MDLSKHLLITACPSLVKEDGSQWTREYWVAYDNISKPVGTFHSIMTEESILRLNARDTHNVVAPNLKINAAF